MRFAGLISSLVFGVCLIAAARAQPLIPHTESIESMAANADHVFIGRLIKFDRSEQGDAGRVRNATVTVEETLKDPSSLVGPFPAMEISVSYSAAVLADWRERAGRLLVAADWDTPINTLVVDLDPEKLEAMTADVKLLRDPNAVLRVAREAIRSMPANMKRIHTFELMVPRSIVIGTSWEEYYDTGGHLLLSVPVDKRLEKRAQNYLRSKEPYRRSEGCRALRYFKSDENIKLVRLLLNDPQVTYVHDEYGGYGGKVRHYGVRSSVYDTFRVWGIEIEKPVILEEVENSGR